VPNFTNRPPSFLRMEDDRLKPELDKAISIIYDAHARLDQGTVKGPQGEGFITNSGSTTVTGSATVASGLITVAHVIASIDSAGAASNQSVTANVNKLDQSKVDLQVWMPTAANNTTPIASTAPTVIRWVVTGS
jgi:hypothetical protein